MKTVNICLKLVTYITYKVQTVNITNLSKEITILIQKNISNFTIDLNSVTNTDRSKMKSLEEKLLKRGIKPTSVRLLIFTTMSGLQKAFSLTDLETELETVNKSTIFRTLSLFHENLLIHSIDDGSGSIKYSICSDTCMCTVGELHVHFNCNRCKNTYCLESISIPAIQLPEKFLLDSVNFVMKGICKDCSRFVKTK